MSPNNVYIIDETGVFNVAANNIIGTKIVCKTDDNGKNDRVFPRTVRFRFPSDSSISDVLIALGVPLSFDCGGTGRCGKCRVEICDDLADLDEKSVAARLSDVNALRFRSVLACQTQISPNLVLRWRGENVAPDFSNAQKRSFSEISNASARTDDFSVATNRRSPDRQWGIAVDLGTTTICVALVDLTTGKVVDSETRRNPQISFGRDVISRIYFASQNAENLKRLQRAVVQTTTEIVESLLKKRFDQGNETDRNSRRYSSFETKTDFFSQITNIVVAGNTVMQYLLLGLNPAPMGASPFVPPVSSFEPISAADVGFPFSCDLFVFPVFSGFVGGDVVSGFVALEERFFQTISSDISLFLDIGTNGESLLLLPDQKKILATATAAGPAFEGSEIRFGSLGVPGAIEKIDFSPVPYWNESERTTTFESPNFYRVVGDVRPKGICGSGLVDAIAETLRLGVLQNNGRFVKKESLGVRAEQFPFSRLEIFENQPAFRLTSRENDRFCSPTDETGSSDVGSPEIGTGDVYLTQKDVRQVQLAVGAIRAGVRLLLEEAGKTAFDLKRVYLAGGFGNFLRRKNVLKIGLLPGEIPTDSIVYCGNMSLLGAIDVLLKPELKRNLPEICRNVQAIDLARLPRFQDVFVQSLSFPDATFDESTLNRRSV